jgi:hypothetical protein
MEARQIGTENGVRAFTFRHLGFSSRLVFNETSLLFFKINLTFTRAVVSLVEVTLP